ncbi:plasma alpha-L-fucosidase-like [Saccostrea echinata]|uniref:plasma alpha-L-fucosidase-like n=1 Tax=Saccostrea echinata TaxID=191078 RepID=UPI002A7EB2DA|nr:plasma alpha-L-fucosidase-like [Saccostrea echinata]
MRVGSLAIIISFASFILETDCQKYQPTWESIDSRPIPAWYDDAKVGMFINWGVYSVPSMHSEWFWWFWKGGPTADVVNFMKKFYPPNFTYADFAKQFRAEFYDPNKWKEIIQASGVKYVVLTSKHCDGFNMYPTNVTYQWNARDVGPKRDLVGPLKEALKGTDVRFGIYHDMIEWFNPLWLEDVKNNYTTNRFVKDYMLPLMYEVVNAYEPDVFWNDGAWLAPSWHAPSWYWNATIFLAWLYNNSPVKDEVVTNDRWGVDCDCKHGGVWTCSDRFHPGHVLPHKWVNAMTLDKLSWGYRRDADLSQYYTIEELLEEMIYTVSFGGNILINAAPTAWGTFDPIYEERFRQLGSWLKVNGEAIYKTKSWIFQNDTLAARAWYTASKSEKNVIYCLVLDWPEKNEITLGSLKDMSVSMVTLLGSDAAVYFVQEATGVRILFPALNVRKMPCLWAWALKITLKK